MAPALSSSPLVASATVVTTATSVTTATDVTTATNVTTATGVTTASGVTTVTGVTTETDVTTVTDISTGTGVTTATGVIMAANVTTATDVTTATGLTTTTGVTPSLTDVTAIVTGFGMVGDNVDQNVRPSFQRGDMQTESWHCFHSYAVVDRVDISHLSDEPPAAVVSSDSVLPSSSDQVELYGEFEVLVLRYIHYLCNCGDTGEIVSAELLCNTLTDLKNKLPVYNGI